MSSCASTLIPAIETKDHSFRPRTSRRSSISPVSDSRPTLSSRPTDFESFSTAPSSPDSRSRDQRSSQVRDSRTILRSRPTIFKFVTIASSHQDHSTAPAIKARPRFETLDTVPAESTSPSSIFPRFQRCFQLFLRRRPSLSVSMPPSSCSDDPASS